MFGFSFTKILLIVAVIAAVYFGVKYLTRGDDDDGGKGDGNDRKKPRFRSKRAAPSDDARAVEDMVRCTVCGAFQARNAGRCARADCPL